MQIILSGITNAGKSACARQLLPRLSRPALLEIDRLFSFFPNLPVPEAGRWCVECAAAVAAHLSKNKFNIITPYPFYHKDLDYYLSRQPSSIPIHLITLAPDAAVALSARGKRRDANWEKKLIEWQLSLNIHRPSRGAVINNTNQPIQDTVAAIYAIITSGAALIKH